MASREDFHSFESIERRVVLIQREIWDKQVSLFEGAKLTPIDMLSPETLAKVLGVELQYEMSLARYGASMPQSTAAGRLDRGRKRITVSEAMPRQTLDFTATHEGAHYDLHRSLTMHRDMPIRGLSAENWLPRVEREANYFAACYLVPKKLLFKAFRAMFLCEQLVLDDATAFAFGRDSADDLMASPPGSLDFAFAVAVAQSYCGRHFDPLTTLFGVSATTMAIRLQETGLVKS